MNITHNTRRRPHQTLLLSLLLLGSAAIGNAGAQQLSGNAALTSDYVWRGSTQSQGDAAIQAGFRISAESGLYAAVSGSSVEFAPQTHASSELDFIVGWTGKLATDWALDANLLHYRYPATTVDLNWTELNSTLTWKDNYWLSLAWSPEALGTEHSGLYSQLAARVPLNPALRLEAMAGYYTLQQTPGGGYAHAQLSAIWKLAAPLELRLSAHASDNHARALFGEDYAGSRWEVALQGAF
ncbi:TorF family putative porin [Stenotrophomonas sp.]|uniref:TorF family putative porin n=1 Tax=Stenotrophomonas sp. TaxID=69392 RepID=UPI0028AFB4E3|nr:TorF family putative porin [Stenotrophomonas sp.]